MSQYKAEPEYSVEESEKILPMGKPLDYTNLISWVQVAAELRLLSKEVSTCTTTLRGIRSSLVLLQVSLEEH